MQRFVRETWELFWWAMFCPSKLQQRMNEWAPAEEKDGRTPDTSSRNILLFSSNFRFIRQLLLLLLCLSLPLALTIAIKAQGWAWLLLPIVLITAYFTSLWFLPMGLAVPLVWWLIYLEQPEAWLKGFNSIVHLMGFIWLIMGWVIIWVWVIIVMILIFTLIEIRLSGDSMIVVFLFLISVLIGILLCNVAVGVVGLVIGVSALSSLFHFLLVSWLVAFSLSPAPNRWLGLFATGILAALNFAHMSWGTLLGVFFALAGYYRLLPDYSLLDLISYLPSSLTVRSFRVVRQDPDPGRILHLLPPYSTELLWLPLPNHYRILVAAFRTNASVALVTFQQMQASPLPGFKPTLKRALPQIVADQLEAVSTIRELASTATPKYPLLPLLVPTFYQSETELVNLGLKTSSPFVEAEISILLPRLQAIAKDVNAALEAGNAALRERGLERILNNLGMLQAQLPGLGLKALAIKRWEPVIKRWQRVIELELEEQQKQSQGELLNPFQYGNPLRREYAYLFKGRQAFADNIVRLVLDRNRPTLVLHGPRRFGKSSFLLNLPRLLPSDMLPIYLDMQSAAVTTDEAAFCQGLVRAISKDSRSQGVELPAIPQRQKFLDTPYIVLEDWLEQAVPKLGDRRLLLNLDEFEKIGSAINEGRMSRNLLNELRHLIQHYDQLGFLFSGVQTLDELGPNWSSYFISVVPIEMLYLEPHEAEDLLVNPDPKFTLRYDTGIVEQILTLTRCHPYLLQLIGWSLVKLANENHTQLVTSDLLQAAIPEAFTSGQPYFTNVWTEFTGTSPTEVVAGQKLLLALAQGHQLTSVTGNETAQAARGRLLRYHVIEYIDGSDHFEVPLIERWVRERAITN